LDEVISLSPLECTFLSLHLGHLREMKLLLHVSTKWQTVTFWQQSMS
jgi:hypothetical protein